MKIIVLIQEGIDAVSGVKPTADRKGIFQEETSPVL